MSASDVGDKPLMLLVRLIQMGTQAEYRKDAGDPAWENALKIAGVPPRMERPAAAPKGSRSERWGGWPFIGPRANQNLR